MKRYPAMAGILTRIFVVLVIITGMGFSASAMGLPASDMHRCEATESHHGETAALGAVCPSGSHDHAIPDGGDCNVHCMMALPGTETVRETTPVVHTLVFSSLVEDRAGRKVPALERPPRL